MHVTTDMRNEYIAQLMMVGVLTFATDMIARLNDAFNRAAKAVSETKIPVRVWNIRVR